MALPLRALEAVVPFGLEVAAAHRSHPAVVHHPTCCKARVQPLCFCAETRLLTAVAGSRLLQRCWAQKAHWRRTSDRSIEHSLLPPGTVH